MRPPSRNSGVFKTPEDGFDYLDLGEEDNDLPVGCETCPNRKRGRDISRPALYFAGFLCVWTMLLTWSPERKWFREDLSTQHWALIALAGSSLCISVPTHTGDIFKR